MVIIVKQRCNRCLPLLRYLLLPSQSIVSCRRLWLKLPSGAPALKMAPDSRSYIWSHFSKRSGTKPGLISKVLCRRTYPKPPHAIVFNFYACRTLLAAAEKLHWPMPVDYAAARLEDRRTFEKAFLGLLKLQNLFVVSLLPSCYIFILSLTS